VIPSLALLLEELAASEPGITAAVADGTTTWSGDGRAFCIAGPLGVELRLDKAIAAAATRTPDTGPSPRGPEWVRFNPRELDGHAVDRVTAWFELAYRRAGE
jgi:hypothetical protein